MEFDTRNFPGNDTILLAFRTLESGKKGEHWLNVASVRCTARNARERMCHVELMVQNKPGLWVRWSINKLKFDFKTHTWLKGSVHCKAVKSTSMDKYVYFAIRLSRERQARMVQFLATQYEAPFNKMGYYVNNFLLPGFHWLAFGVKQFYPRLYSEQKAWFCCEIIVTALQAAGIEGFRNVNACITSPNSLYRIVVDPKFYEAYATNNPMMLIDLHV